MQGGMGRGSAALHATQPPAGSEVPAGGGLYRKYRFIDLAGQGLCPLPSDEGRLRRPSASCRSALRKGAGEAPCGGF